MYLRWSEFFNLSIGCLILACIMPTIHAQSNKYSQDDINKAWLKMINRDTFYRPFNNQLGCWPQNIVPYFIEPDFNAEQVEHIQNHIYQLQNRTCIRWVEKSKLSKVKKYVEFKHTKKNPNECYKIETGNSRVGVKSIIVLGDECFPKQAVIHEMMHSLGFQHEHQRIDRDCYVDVKESRALTDSAFKIIYNDNEFERWPYDKRSIMHYTRLLKTLTDKDEPFGGLFFKYRLGDSYGWWGSVGKRYGRLTFLDAYKINYRFCGAPDFCESQPEMCKQIEEEEKQEGCKDLYQAIESGKLKPTI